MVAYSNSETQRAASVECRLPETVRFFIELTIGTGSQIRVFGSDGGLTRRPCLATCHLSLATALFADREEKGG
jgi:hypothetical protein